MTVIIIFAVLFLLLFASLSLVVGRDLKRQLTTLAGLACPSCARLYGIETARSSREQHLAECREQRRQHPDLRINFARFWNVRCQNCEGITRFHYEESRLENVGMGGA
jgi:hypothetical protein